MLKTMSTPSAPTTQSLGARSARDLEDLGSALAELAARAHDRLTVKQSLFFITVAFAHAMGRSVTLTDVMTQFEGTGSLGGAIRKSYDVFLPHHGLGWITQEENADDRRIKFLKLTDEGVRIVDVILKAMRGD